MNTLFNHNLLLATFAMLLAFSIPTVAQEHGSVSEEFQGEGTAQSPYIIQSAADLRLLSDRAAVGNTFEGEYFQMTNDIVINQNVLLDNGEVNAADSANFEKWIPIKNFCGTFDGQRHSISGLFINGLFNNVTKGTVRCLVIKDAYLTSPAIAAILSDAEIYEIISYATVEIPKLIGAYGGICGYVSSSGKNTVVSRCANLGKSCNGGGIVGQLRCYKANTTVSIKDCINRANSCYAGIASTSLKDGYLNVLIENCINLGTAQYGGIIRSIFNSTLMNCVNIGEISEGYAIANTMENMEGYAKTYYLETSASKSNNATSMTAKQMQNESFLNTLNNNAKALLGVCQWVKGDDGYPTLEWITVFHQPRGWLDQSAKEEMSADLLGDGSEENPYLISSIADLRRLAANCAEGRTYRDDYVRLTNDLVYYHGLLKDGKLNGYTYDYEQSPYINCFYGTFDGDGHSISGLCYPHEALCGGLFLGLYGTVKNLHIKESYVGSGIAHSLGSSDDNKYHASIIGCAFNGYAAYAGIAYLIGGKNILIQDCVNYGISEYAGIVYKSIDSKCTVRVDRCLNCGETLYGIYGIAWGDVLISNSVNAGKLQTDGAGIMGYGGSSKYSKMTVNNCLNIGEKGYAGIAYKDVGTINISNVVNIPSENQGTAVGIIYNIQNGATISNAYYLETAGRSSYYSKSGSLTEKKVMRMTAKEMKQQSFLDELNKNAAALGNDYSKWKFGSDGFPTLEWITDGLLDGVTSVLYDDRSQTTSTHRGVYNISGQLIRANSTNLEGLPRGIYIVEGKKIVLGQ